MTSEGYSYNKLLDIPTINEITNILLRRDSISKYHTKLYRKLNDIIGYTPSSNNIINKFIIWASGRFNISNLSILMYYMYIKNEINISSIDLLPICKFIKENNLVYNKEIEEFDYYSRFNSMNDAIRWILAYRISRFHFLHNMKEIYEDDINSEV